MHQPDHFLRMGSPHQELEGAGIDPALLRKDIEPWLSAVLQSDHLSLLIGSGLPIAVSAIAGVRPALMTPVVFTAPEAAQVDAWAHTLAERSGRGAPNMEDQLKAALQLLGGMEVLGDDRARAWAGEVERAITVFTQTVLEMERGIAEAIDSGSDGGLLASAHLVSFLLTFASRPASRERLHVFTTNYDRLLEFGCDLSGIRILDRFVGTIEPRFHASRLDIDLHYNPPGIRSEPRYLEGVVRLTKLHGSLDWVSDARGIKRVPLQFGTLENGQFAGRSLMIYPNPAKDVETLEYPYAELFRDLAAALCRPNSALITYGYGFGDDHINRILRDMLTLPSTHLVIVAYSDESHRISEFFTAVRREQQVSLMVGPRFGALDELVENYLPKPTLEPLIVRRAEIVRRTADARVAESQGDGGPI